MGTILKVSIEEQIWNDTSKKFEKEIREYDQESYEGDWESLLLKNIDSWDIEQYAEFNLGMVDEDDIITPRCSIERFDTEEIEDEMKTRGFVLFAAQSITEMSMLEEMKEKMNR